MLAAVEHVGVITRPSILCSSTSETTTTTTASRLLAAFVQELAFFILLLPKQSGRGSRGVQVFCHLFCFPCPALGRHTYWDGGSITFYKVPRLSPPLALRRGNNWWAAAAAAAAGAAASISWIRP
ncbi:hypothetical protein U9M48_032378 [Paspalum notatum var. saurae]|uniref:Uncharacterized protein n=1 Tax=Paspalum notatum var. saurae TaxID=547442 RepID=A0AAQ3X5D4_PASNO